VNKVHVSPSLVTIIEEQLTKEEIVRRVSAPLLAAGLVKESYTNALLEREKSFPTGLPTEGIGVAIPHTDCEHVNMAAMAIGILRHPIQFQNMVDPEQGIDVRILFMLAIDEPHGQIEMLQRLTDVLQDASLLQTLVLSAGPADAWRAIEPSLKSLL